MTQVSLPKLSQTGPAEWADVEDNDVALRDVINGGLDNSNIAPGAAIDGSKIAGMTTSTVDLVDQKQLTANVIPATSTTDLGNLTFTTSTAGNYIFICTFDFSITTPSGTLASIGGLLDIGGVGQTEDPNLVVEQDTIATLSKIWFKEGLASGVVCKMRAYRSAAGTSWTVTASRTTMKIVRYS